MAKRPARAQSDPSDPWLARLRQAQAVTATWLTPAGVLPLLRTARAVLGSPGLAPTLVIPAMAEVLGIELLLDAGGGIAERPFSTPQEGERRAQQLLAESRVRTWARHVNAVTHILASLLPPDAPFEIGRSRLTVAELLLTPIDLERAPAEIAADVQFPPAAVLLDRHGGSDVAWFANGADIAFARQLGRALRPRTRRTVQYAGGGARRTSDRALRARAGVRALLERYPHMTAERFEPHWPQPGPGRAGDLVWAAFASTARWTPADGRYSRAWFARLLREARATHPGRPSAG